MSLSTPAERQRAAELRGRGLSYGQIAYMLGRDWTTIYRWLNPKAQRKNRERARRWRARKPAPARRSRRESHHRTVAEGKWGPCRQCGKPLRAKPRPGKTGVCAVCMAKDREFYWREIQQRFLAGESVSEMAEAMGRREASITSAIRSMRENGWDVPYRRLDSRRLDLAVTS